MLMLVFFAYINANAQVQNNGSIYVASGVSMYVAAGSYNFGNAPAATATFKNTTAYGKLLFESGVTANGASDSHYINGYASYNGSDPFLYPLGDGGFYAPVKIASGTATATDAAYYLANPAAVSAVLETTLTSISATEYWDIKGTASSATVSLTWRESSDVASITGNDINNVVVAGFNSATARWEELTSVVDFVSVLGGYSSITKGSVTATGVNLATYRYFTLAGKVDGCAPLIASSGNIKTWDGTSWSPSPPTLSDPVVIDGPYSGNLSCNSLVLNADISLANGQYLEIVYGCTGSGKVNMESEASIVQRSTTSTAPAIAMVKTTGLKRKLDYIYWGTPIAENFFSQLDNAIAEGQSTAGAFDQKYKYVTGAGGGWQSLTAITNGKGFITRVKQQAPFTDATTQARINLPLTGTANNGNVTVTVANNPASPNGGSSYELLANPYPSALDAARFLRANDLLDGTLYFWTAATASTGSGAGQYTQADYALWNLAGNVVTSPSSQLPTGKIASGQGFRVKALGTGSVSYTNCMRITNGNDNFFRMAAQDVQERDRFKLTMTADNGVFSQIQIGYFQEATMGYDRLYDAGRNSVSTSQLYSFIDTQKIAINTRPSFVVTDTVPLGVSKGSGDEGQFSISISNREGIFTQDVTVYLYDSEYGIYWDLAVSPYTFAIEAASQNDRFYVVYQMPDLNNGEVSQATATAYIKNGQLNVNSNRFLERVEVYDLAGRLIEVYDKLSGTQLTKPFNHEEAVYMAKIKLSNGAIADAKLINIK
ncbi:hypothetical protein HYN59_16110 [Flavobacterium album]|uniref:Secretion system C-terminal sorting domain-containing protein n=1 Tax=Flavobacterium album TaxID=2175091 RepID=A0A2S1R1L8_9FLAO|nr:hypothetical protein [Flavobacterium album]AWH86535.1 hypothetical protein HYN59_16110 [Flavobacterium album]